MQKFKKLTKPSEIDGLTSEILSQSKFGTLQAVREYTADVWNTWKQRLTFDFDWSNIQVEIPRITIDNIAKLFAFFGAFLICRRFNISFVFVMISAGLYFLYLHLDFECRKVCRRRLLKLLHNFT